MEPSVTSQNDIGDIEQLIDFDTDAVAETLQVRGNASPEFNCTRDGAKPQAGLNNIADLGLGQVNFAAFGDEVFSAQEKQFTRAPSLTQALLASAVLPEDLDLKPNLKEGAAGVQSEHIATGMTTMGTIAPDRLVAGQPSSQMSAYGVAGSRNATGVSGRDVGEYRPGGGSKGGMPLQIDRIVSRVSNGGMAMAPLQGGHGGLQGNVGFSNYQSSSMRSQGPAQQLSYPQSQRPAFPAPLPPNGGAPQRAPHPSVYIQTPQYMMQHHSGAGGEFQRRAPAPQQRPAQPPPQRRQLPQQMINGGYQQVVAQSHQMPQQLTMPVRVAPPVSSRQQQRATGMGGYGQAQQTVANNFGHPMTPLVSAPSPPMQKQLQPQLPPHQQRQLQQQQQMVFQDPRSQHAADPPMQPQAGYSRNPRKRRRPKMGDQQISSIPRTASLSSATAGRRMVRPATMNRRQLPPHDPAKSAGGEKMWQPLPPPSNPQKFHAKVAPRGRDGTKCMRSIGFKTLVVNLVDMPDRRFSNMIMAGFVFSDNMKNKGICAVMCFQSNFACEILLCEGQQRDSLVDYVKDDLSMLPIQTLRSTVFGEYPSCEDLKRQVLTDQRAALGILRNAAGSMAAMKGRLEGFDISLDENLRKLAAKKRESQLLLLDAAPSPQPRALSAAQPSQQRHVGGIVPQPRALSAAQPSQQRHVGGRVPQQSQPQQRYQQVAAPMQLWQGAVQQQGNEAVGSSASGAHPMRYNDNAARQPYLQNYDEQRKMGSASQGPPGLRMAVNPRPLHQVRYEVVPGPEAVAPYSNGRYPQAALSTPQRALGDQANNGSKEIPQDSAAENYRCQHCGKDYSCKSSLNRHLRVHQGFRPFQCEVCQKRFSDRSTLNTHGRIHSGERPFQCGTCGKSFVQKGNLLRHQRVHTGERPFKCRECGKLFSQKGHLATHSRTHSGVKPFQCHFCAKKFVQKGTLVGHMRTHTGAKPFKCPKCPRFFSQRGNLKTHLKVHEKGAVGGDYYPDIGFNQQPGGHTEDALPFMGASESSSSQGSRAGARSGAESGGGGESPLLEPRSTQGARLSTPRN